MVVDVRGERVREVVITHADGEVVRISKTGPELANFEVADVPNGRELSYPGVANVVGNALRELNLEDVEPAGAAPAEPPTIVEYRTFDGLVVRVTGIERNDESWITLEASVDARSGRGSRRPPRQPAADGATPAAPPRPIRTPRRRAINAKVGGWRYQDRRLPVRPDDAPHGGSAEGAARRLTGARRRARLVLNGTRLRSVNCVPFASSRR